VSIANSDVAEVVLDGNYLTIEAKSEGQTTLSIEADNTYTATITVRKGANDNGWL
jgi:autotransporter-associated beta strand protein